MSSNIFIELANPAHSYFAGQLVHGNFIAKNESNSSLKIEEVIVQLQGVGRLNWTETEFTNKSGIAQSYRSENFSSSEIYVDQKLSLAGGGQNVLEPLFGTISYPFEFTLPKSCPSSFASQSGSVSYSVQAEIRQALQKTVEKTTLPITVNAIVDLNLEVDATRPQKLEKMKSGNALIFRNGEAKFVLKLPKKSGFIPGEVLDFVVEVTNNSNTNVSGMTAAFNQIKSYHASGKTKAVEKVIFEVKGPQVEAGHKETWMPQNLIIPFLPPTHLGGSCRIIDVEYYIAVKVNFTGLSSPISGQLPVFIGTVALRNAASMSTLQDASPITRKCSEHPPDDAEVASTGAVSCDLEVGINK